jgi:hypothetical protein
MLEVAQVTVCSQINNKKNTVWAEFIILKC